MTEETKKEEVVAEEIETSEENISTEEVEGSVATEEESKGIVDSLLRNDIPDIKPGDTVKVYQKITEVKDGKAKERIQAFEGVVLARKHGKGISATITVRKVIDSVGVERVFPIHSPFIEKIEVIRSSRVRRAKLYYLREAKGRKARLKTKEEKATKEGE